MRSTRLTVLFFVLAALALVACGGEGGSTRPDAQVFMDAAIDAPPPGVTGLGQKCGAGLPACPANASECFGLAGVSNQNMYCSPKCVTAGTATGGANNQLTNVQPAPNSATCAASYSGGIGQGVCGVVLAFTPMDAQIVNGKAYTGVDFGCAILCGAGNTCPASLAVTMLGQNCLCLPR
jgi:hypothetical protein